MVKHLPTVQETRFNPWVGKISWRRKWQPTPVFLPRKSHGWWNLVGYSPWGCKESDMTERLHFLSFFLFFFFFIYLFIFYFIFKLYIIVFVLPNIKMNPPQVYMCSLSWTLLPPPSPYHHSGSSQCTSPKHPVSCIEPGESKILCRIVNSKRVQIYASKGRIRRQKMYDKCLHYDRAFYIVLYLK